MVVPSPLVCRFDLALATRRDRRRLRTRRLRMKHQGPKEARFEQVIERSVEICANGGIAASDHDARKRNLRALVVREQCVQGEVDT